MKQFLWCLFDWSKDRFLAVSTHLTRLWLTKKLLQTFIKKNNPKNNNNYWCSKCKILLNHIALLLNSLWLATNTLQLRCGKAKPEQDHQRSPKSSLKYGNSTPLETYINIYISMEWAGTELTIQSNVQRRILIFLIISFTHYILLITLVVKLKVNTYKLQSDATHTLLYSTVHLRWAL